MPKACNAWTEGHESLQVMVAPKCYRNRLISNCHQHNDSHQDIIVIMIIIVIFDYHQTWGGCPLALSPCIERFPSSWFKSSRVALQSLGGAITHHFHLDLQYEDTIGALAELESLGHPWQVRVIILFL